MIFEMSQSFKDKYGLFNHVRSCLSLWNKQRLIVEQCGYTNRLPSLPRTTAVILLNQNDLKNKAMFRGCSRATTLSSVNWMKNNVWGDSHRYLQVFLCHREQGGLGTLSTGAATAAAARPPHDSHPDTFLVATYERTFSKPLARANLPVRVLLPDPLVGESHPKWALWDT